MSDVRAELEARLSSVQHSAEEQVTHVKVELESAQAKLQVRHSYCMYEGFMISLAKLILGYCES